jgi:hypothetical protein
MGDVATDILGASGRQKLGVVFEAAHTAARS